MDARKQSPSFETAFESIFCCDSEAFIANNPTIHTPPGRNRRICRVCAKIHEELGNEWEGTDSSSNSDGVTNAFKTKALSSTIYKRFVVWSRVCNHGGDRAGDGDGGGEGYGDGDGAGDGDGDDDGDGDGDGAVEMEMEMETEMEMEMGNYLSTEQTA